MTTKSIFLGIQEHISALSNKKPETRPTQNAEHFTTEGKSNIANQFNMLFFMENKASEMNWYLSHSEGKYL